MFGISVKDVLGTAIMLFVFASTIWGVWVTDPKYPERMKKLRKLCGVDQEKNTRDTD